MSSSLYLLQDEEDTSQSKNKKVSAHCPLHCFDLELFKSKSSMHGLPIPHLYPSCNFDMIVYFFGH